MSFSVKNIVRVGLLSCGGLLVAGTILYGIRIFKPAGGQGGLETTQAPVYTIDPDENGTDQDGLDTMPASENQEEDDNILSYHSYRVKKGDMISVIAENFDVTQDTIISVNNIRQSRLIQIGQYLKIPSMPGILYSVRTDGETPESIALKYEVAVKKCAEVNNMNPETALTAGTVVFVPDAQLDWVTRQEINGDLFVRPIRARYYLSSPYGWRNSPFTGRRSFHTGVDMACPKGTSIYAALAGKVTTVGFSPVYGNYVIVTHHSGYQTLYGHMSAVLVIRGQHVTTASRLGRVGSTGMSTGPHLHFTVMKNGKTVNPVNYWN
jgi:murein DD-endopeptidase MepM/ murein hydrolase activator NlpD